MGKKGEKWGISQSVFPIPHNKFPIFPHFPPLVPPPWCHTALCSSNMAPHCVILTWCHTMQYAVLTWLPTV